MILAHSFLCSGEMWAPQVTTLSKSYTVVNVDIRGHGHSTLHPQPFDLYNLADDFIALLDHLGIKRAVWAGLSIGGMIALRAALTAAERVSGLILLDTDADAETIFRSVKYRTMVAISGKIGTGPFLPEISRLFFCKHTRTTRPELISSWKSRFATVSIKTIERTIDALCHRDSLIDRLGTIELPTLVIVGQEDRSLPPNCSEKIAAGIKGAEYATISQAGHLSNLEQPDTVNHLMLRFMQQHFT